MTRVLLTGAGGFVAHHALEHFLETTDWEIVCTDSFRHRGKTDRIREVLDGRPQHRSRVKVLVHDLRVPISVQLAREIGAIDYVVSIASESHVDRSITDPRSFIENNVQIVLTLLEYAREHPVEKFLHISTDEVFGPAEIGHDHDEEEPYRPSNPYAASKAAQTDIVYAYWRTFGMPCGVSQTMNIIGERQDPEKFMPMVLSRAVAGETVTIHAAPPLSRSDGWRPGSRFYLHARNQADALRFLLETQPFPRYGEWAERPAEDLTSEFDPSKETLAGMGRWNVVGEREIDNLEMARMIAEFAGVDLDYEFVDFHSSRPGHDLRYALDGAKMADLGWKPPVPLEASLRKTVEWTLEHRHWLIEDNP